MSEGFDESAETSQEAWNSLQPNLPIMDYFKQYPSILSAHRESQIEENRKQNEYCDLLVEIGEMTRSFPFPGPESEER